jgi:hypothetical protein
MIAADGIEAHCASFSHFESSHLIEDSGASVAIAGVPDTNPSCVLDEKGYPLVPSPILTSFALCLPEVTDDPFSASPADTSSLGLTLLMTGLAEDRK